MTKIWKSLAGENIRELRVARSWTQKDLANAAGCSRATIAAIELGYEKDPSATMLINIATALGTTAETLLSKQTEGTTRALRNPADILNELKALFDAMPVRLPVLAEDQSEIDVVLWPKSKVGETSGAGNILALKIEESTLEPDARRGDVLFADSDIAPSDGDLVICEHKTTGRLAPCRYRDNKDGLWIQSPDRQAQTDDWEIRGVVMEVNRKLKDYVDAKRRAQYETVLGKYAETFKEYENQLVEQAANIVREYTTDEKGKEFEDKLRKSFKSYQKAMKKYSDPFKIFQK